MIQMQIIKEEYIIKINNTLLNRQFKEIQRQCLTDGVIIPDIFSTVPTIYHLTENEKRMIITDNTKLQEGYKQRRKEEIQILNNEHEEYKTIKELQEAELLIFLKQYPQYKNIILIEEE